MKSRKAVLLVCSGNTCRSPMAKAILKHRLGELGISGHFNVESAAISTTTDTEASPYAREAIKLLYLEDLLAGHKPKGITPKLIEKADFILVMTGAMKYRLPATKTYTVTEYGCGTGDIMDPLGGDLDCYIKCAKELSSIIDKVITRLLRTKPH